MNKNTIIKMIKKLEVTELSGEKVMIDFETGKYFMVKGAGNDIWDMLEEDISVGEIVSKLLTIYDIDEATCEASVISFLQSLLENNFIQVA